MTPQASLGERQSADILPHTEQVAPGERHDATELTCWWAGPDCRGPVELRWLDAEQWASLPACERHYAEWRREELVIDAAIDAALDEEGGAVPETPALPEAPEAEMPAAREVPAQSREPEAEPTDQSAAAGVGVNGAEAHADDGVSFW
jgi:hypothetical protein